MIVKINFQSESIFSLGVWMQRLTQTVVLTAMMGVSTLSSASDQAPELSPAIQAGDTRSVLDVFCESTVPSYAAAFSEGHRDLILRDLFQDPAFEYLTPGQRKAFLSLLDSSTTLGDQDQIAAACKNLVNLTLRHLSVASYQACQAWGESAQTVLTSVRMNGVDATRAGIDAMSRHQPIGAANMRVLLDSVLKVRPDVTPEQFGAAYYEHCLESLIERSSK